jgi:thiol-disulfide isomerase/thioredoxin
MLKLLAITIVLVSLSEAESSSKKIKTFVEKTLKNNPNIRKVEVTITHEVKLKKPIGWSGYIVNLNAVLAKDGKKVSQKTIWFSNSDVITSDLINISNGESLKALVAPDFKKQYYKDEHLIYGNKNAKHKVVIFSDPLCPFCRTFVPSAINDMKKNPKKFAIYYYHFPLASLHPAAVELTKAAIALELKGTHKDVVLKLYNVKVDPRERNVKKILKAFNKTMHSNIKVSNLNSIAVLKHIKDDMSMADLVMVQGTPTVFFDGKIDREKNKYKTAK